VESANTFDVKAWRDGFFDAEDPPNGFYVLEDVPGMPPDLVGTFFRNGPGKFTVSGTRVRHHLDGDGLVLAVTFTGSKEVCVRHRLTQTQGLLRDAYEKRIVSKGRYGTEAQGGLPFDTRRSQVKNTANAGIVWWEDRLLALWPFGKPYLIDPGSLGTILGNQESAASDLGGALDEEVGFGATPRVCASTGNLVNFDQVAGAYDTQVRFFEFPAGQWRPRYRVPRTISIKSNTYFSDFAVTPTWFVLARPPLLVDAMGAALGKSFTDVLQYDPRGHGEFVFATRAKEGSEELIVPVDGLVCQEFANAYELENGRVVLDVVASERWDLGKPPNDDELPIWEAEDPSMWPRMQLVRYEVDVSTKEWTKTILCKRHLGFASVNPVVIGRKHRFVFCAVGHCDAGIGPTAGVAKIDTDSGAVDAWVPGPAEFGAQPIFVPRAGSSGEDDGYILSVVLDGKSLRSDVIILDANRVSQGPVCRFALEQPLPHGLRGCWAEGLAFTPAELQRKMVLRRMFEKKAQQWNAMSTNFAIFSDQIFFEKQGGKMR